MKTMLKNQHGLTAAPIIDSTAIKTTETSENDLIIYRKIGTKK